MYLHRSKLSLQISSLMLALMILSGCSLNAKKPSKDKYSSHKKQFLKENSSASDAVENRNQPKKSTVIKKWHHGHVYKFKDCTEDFKHVHKYVNKNHEHKLIDTCQWFIEVRQRNKLDIHGLQRKLKAKGYYFGSIQWSN